MYNENNLFYRSPKGNIDPNKPGPAQASRIQGSKIAKGLPGVNLQYSKIEKPKKWTEWR